MSEVNITLITPRSPRWQNAKSWQNASGRAAIMVRFWSLVGRLGEGCWEYGGHVNNRGYGVFSVEGIRVKAHRFVWAIARGPIPDGLNICHRCDNTVCVNPAHLYIGTQAANMHDSVRKGRKRAWGLQKLDAHQVLEIRARCAAGERQIDVATAFGIARNTVSGIVNRKSWAHLHHESQCEPTSLADPNTCSDGAQRVRAVR